MNRMEEYCAILAEMEQAPAGLDTTVDRALTRKKIRTRKLIWRPVGSLAACFAVFVLLVNFSAPVAYACSRIPGLRELAEAVTFSRSLSDAVENEYVQPMDLIQSENGVTAEVSYLIVDQKQVNVFYKLDSKLYESLSTDPDVRNGDDSQPTACNYSTNDFGPENGELRCLSIDFVTDHVPDSLIIRLQVYSNAIAAEAVAPEKALEDAFADIPEEERDYLAVFDFHLDFDPKFTAAGKVFPVNQTVELDGQRITITDIEVYPTHMRVDIMDDRDNTAWLRDLDFYVETDWGMKFEPGSSGITATGSADSPTMDSYRADSAYFYEAKHLKLVITGAEFLRKDMEKTYVNLKTGETGELPQGITFDSVRKLENGWVVKFRAAWQKDTPMYQIFGSTFYDAQGKEYSINQWSTVYGEADENGEITCFYEEIPLRNYPYEEAWLRPSFSHNWTAQDAIVVVVQ